MHSTNFEETERLGAKIGAHLRGGELIELVSDLGGGKTTLTRGLVRGAGSTDKVASPTFTISKEYRAPNFTIVHFDFYRLAEAGIVAAELSEFIGDSQYVVVVEWGDIVQEVLPQERLTVRLKLEKTGGREIEILYSPQLEYLVEGVTS